MQMHYQARIPCQKFGRLLHSLTGTVAPPIQDELIVSTVNLAGDHTAKEVRQAKFSDECVGKILQVKEIYKRPTSEFSRGQSPKY